MPEPKTREEIEARGLALIDAILDGWGGVIRREIEIEGKPATIWTLGVMPPTPNPADAIVNAADRDPADTVVVTYEGKDFTFGKGLIPADAIYAAFGIDDEEAILEWATPGGLQGTLTRGSYQTKLIPGTAFVSKIEVS